MTKLSISAAWDETAEFLKRDAGALFIIAFAFIALPQVALQALVPGLASPGEQSLSPIWLLVIVATMVLSMAGTLAISALALGRENVVGRAIALGFRRFPALLGASILVGLVVGLAGVALALIAGIDGRQLTAPTSEAAGRLLLLIVPLMLLFAFIWIRLMLMTPIAAAEEGGPLALIRRSWRLTAGRFWRLLGFVLLAVLVILVMSRVATIVVGLVISLVAGRPDPGTLPGLLLALVAGIVNAAIVMVFTTMVARIYAQLAPAPKTGI